MKNFKNYEKILDPILNWHDLQPIILPSDRFRLIVFQLRRSVENCVHIVEREHVEIFHSCSGEHKIVQEHLPHLTGRHCHVNRARDSKLAEIWKHSAVKKIRMRNENRVDLAPVTF